MSEPEITSEALQPTETPAQEQSTPATARSMEINQPELFPFLNKLEWLGTTYIGFSIGQVTNYISSSDWILYTAIPATALLCFQGALVLYRRPQNKQSQPRPLRTYVIASTLIAIASTHCSWLFVRSVINSHAEDAAIEKQASDEDRQRGVELLNQNTALRKENADFKNQLAQMQNTVDSQSANYDMISGDEAQNYLQQYPLGCIVFSISQSASNSFSKAHNLKLIAPHGDHKDIHTIGTSWLERSRFTVNDRVVSVKFLTLNDPADEHSAFSNNTLVIERRIGAGISLITNYTQKRHSEDPFVLVVATGLVDNIKQTQQFDDEPRATVAVHFKILSVTKSRCIMVVGINAVNAKYGQ